MEINAEKRPVPKYYSCSIKHQTSNSTQENIVAHIEMCIYYVMFTFFGHFRFNN